MATLPRRSLPPMSQLCAFESAARHQSFTVAAVELNLTQSAISRQIRALEDLLGFPLFVRDRQTVRLSKAGASYAREIRTALRLVSKATLGFRSNSEDGTVNLATRPTFGSRWLAPRLPRFYAAHPGITINLKTMKTNLGTSDFQTEQVDAAIHFGLQDIPGLSFEYLHKEIVVPVCSQQLLEQHGFRVPADLLAAPLLHLMGRLDAWQQWFSESGVDCKQVSGMTVDQFAVAAEAASAGLGVALLPTFLIENELARGDLVIPIDKRMESRAHSHYYLVWPNDKRNYPPLVAFREWIKGEVAIEGKAV